MGIFEKIVAESVLQFNFFLSIRHFFEVALFHKLDTRPLNVSQYCGYSPERVG